ncbi:two-component regulator propeller domain-containing protein [Algibacter sp. Ld11]|uniref:two-component regulator propeller domain-containing protein n=1 Tax=Algibacter sp. Ld11 TaxID=649150 RepID=UPI00386C248A
MFLCNTIFSQQIKFKTLTTSEGLSNNTVGDLVNDVDGGLWIATNDGLNYYDGSTFKVFKHVKGDSSSLSGNFILNVLRDHDGFIWLKNKQKSVSKYIGNGKFENFEFKSVPSDIFISKNKKVTVVCENEYYEYNGVKFIPVEKVSSYYVSRDLVLRKILNENRPDVLINDVLKDSRGNIWYATRNHGLFYINTELNANNKENLQNFVHDPYNPYSFKSNEIQKLFEDNTGHVWLAHKDGGLSMAFANSDKITTVTPHPIKNKILPNETVRAIVKSNDNSLWLGYYTKGIYYFDNLKNAYKQFSIKEAEVNSDWYRIRSMFLDSHGTIWIGTYAGLINISNKTYQLFPASNHAYFINNRNYSIVEDNAENLWVACWSGLAKFNLRTNRFESFKGQNQFLEYNVRHVSFFEDEVIVSTELHGVFLLNTITGDTQHISVSDNILADSVYYVYKDYLTNNYWIATSGGISVFNKQEGVVKNITEEDGLPSHVVFSLILNNSTFWISTSKGIATIDKNDYSVKRFPAHEGWQAAEFSEGAYFQDSKGFIYYGGINGFSYFQPSAMDLSKKKTRLKLNIDGKDKFEDQLVKPYSNNKLKIEITPIYFSGDHNLKILYKLEGLDSTWKETSDFAEINYTNIPSGSYQFKIKNKGEANSSSQIKLVLTINNPYYSTVWFYLSSAAFLVLVLGIFIYRKNINHQKRQKDLEEQILERTNFISKQKESLQKTNAKLDEKNKEILKQKEQLLAVHNNLKTEEFELEKFKTFAFAEFQEPISKIQKAANKLEDVNLLKDVISSESKKFINIINEWFYLDHTKDLAASRATSVLLKELLSNVINALHVKLKKTDINFNYRIKTSSVSYIEIDTLRFKLLFQYLFHDIFKYSESQSELNLNVDFKDDSLILKIESNSRVLIDNWDIIAHYSPYFKASKILMVDIDAIVDLDLASGFDLQLKIPVKALSTEKKVPEVVLWKHMKLDEELPINKKNILVFSDNSDFNVVQQLLDNSNNKLIFESEERALISAISHLKVSMLFLYNTSLTNGLVSLLSNLNKNRDKLYIPIVYVSEQISLIQDQQFNELDLDLKLTMPIPEDVFQKKMKKVFAKQEKINQKQEKESLYEHINVNNEFLSVNEKLVKKGLLFIKDNLSDAAFNVERLVELLDISRIKCYRVFKDTLKQAPSEIILSLRIEKAEYLLREKKLNISEVGFECGFNDPKYFSKTFKKHKGITPKAYIKEMQ